MRWCPMKTIPIALRCGAGRAIASGVLSGVVTLVLAGGQIANEFVKDAPADGTIALLTPIATMAAYPHSYAKLRYDPFKDYAPIAHVADFALASILRRDTDKWGPIIRASGFKPSD